ncbi:hypothetical protein LCGC14_1112860 [marine sediment metagenome]|uniref:DUF2769 domain-containing protein n=1 Tax=marine sediment metagenome TaxID=412755 RepID=A0A0F9MAZ7_9ZZZZ|nr:DUF2769 domain-containing protein [archaeon]
MSDEDYYAANFEEKMKMLHGKMSEKQKRDSREQVIYMCRDYCGKCPSYEGTGEDSLAFCMEGKSSLITEKKTCLCGQCPITKTMSLRWGQYCTDGSAMDLSQTGM